MNRRVVVTGMGAVTAMGSTWHEVSAGLSNREIAAQLYLSPGTIKTHVHNICGKLGASNRTQAVTLARDLDLI